MCFTESANIFRQQSWSRLLNFSCPCGHNGAHTWLEPQSTLATDDAEHLHWMRQRWCASTRHLLRRIHKYAPRLCVQTRVNLQQNISAAGHQIKQGLNQGERAELDNITFNIVRCSTQDIIESAEITTWPFVLPWSWIELTLGLISNTGMIDWCNRPRSRMEIKCRYRWIV